MKKTVVIVDDNKELLEVYQEMLEGQNYNVVCFNLPQKAKDYLLTFSNTDEIQAIVSDLMMAPTDGLEFLSFVKSQGQLAHIDFFLLTGAMVSVFEPFLRTYTISGVISKPFKADTLISALARKSSDKNLQSSFSSIKKMAA